MNGSTAGPTSFAATGARENRVTETITVQAGSGSSTVRLVATGSDGPPNTDYLEPPSGKA